MPLWSKLLNPLISDLNDWFPCRPGQYSYFRVRLAERLPAKFELVTKSGNPDAFISTSIDEPTIVNHTWRLASTGKQDSLVVLPADPHYGLFYYIGVHGYNKSATFEISVQLGTLSGLVELAHVMPHVSVSENELQPPVSAMSPTFGKAGHSGHAVGLPASSAVAADPNARLCNNWSVSSCLFLKKLTASAHLAACNTFLLAAICCTVLNASAIIGAVLNVHWWFLSAAKIPMDTVLSVTRLLHQ